MSTSAASIEVVRGVIDDELADQLIGFWSDQGALEGPAAHDRLPAVVCVATDEDGQIVGTNSVESQVAPLVRRQFWVYRSLLADPSDDDLANAMFNAAFEALEEESNGAEAEPVGLCLAVQDRGTLERWPEAIWPATELLFAGYLPDGRQLRIRYFANARIGPGVPESPTLDQALANPHALNDAYRLESLAASESVTKDDVIAFWEREGVLPAELARSRAEQVSLVGVTEAEELAGVSTVYLKQNPQLRADVWYYRTFVGSDHRHSNLAAQLLFRNRDLLEERFVSGEDRRGNAMIFELENEGLKRYLNRGVWAQSRFTFIGENARGDHVRVSYFPGAQLPQYSQT
jgi:hypothetical protein